jgi:choline-glycine betaine transporter
MQEYNNSEYFFENFKGGGRGGGRGGSSNDKGKNKDNTKRYIFNIFITLAIIGFLYFVNKLFPKQTTAVLKRYEAFDYMNQYIYLIVAFIAFVILYVIISAYL